jgi:hypothetical protein
MTRFFRKHFDYSNPNLREALEDFRERFELRVQDLEQAELKLRDHVAKGGIEQSYRMAELSIRESKRVMICMSQELSILFILLIYFKYRP